VVLRVESKVPTARSKNQLSVTLVTDNPDFPEWLYVVDYESVPRLTVDNQYLHIGTFREPQVAAGVEHPNIESDARLVVNMFNQGPKPDGTPPQIKVDKNIQVQLQADGPPERMTRNIWNQKYNADLHVAGINTNASGTHNQPIVFTSPDGDQVTSIIAWRIDKQISVTPSAVQFGFVKGEEPSKPRRVILRSPANREFRIVNVDSNVQTGGPTLDVKSEPAMRSAAPTHVLTMVFKKGDGDGASEQSGKLTVRTDSTEFPTLDIPWTAFLEP